MGKRYILTGLLILGLASIACAGLTADRLPAISIEPSQPSFAYRGKLAVVGEDGNLYLLTAGEEPQPLTTDAAQGTFDEPSRQYFYPTWSANGWLSYVRIETLPEDAPETTLFATRPEAGEPIAILRSDEENYIYGYWSPTACASGPTCGQIAFLMSGETNLALHLAEVDGGSAEATSERVIGRSQPFYYSWSPDGSSMLWFRNGEDLSIYDVATDQVSVSLPDIPGVFQAPAWSPVDERLLFARSDDGKNLLTIADDEERISLGESINDVVFFNWSPDGERVAMASGTMPHGDLTIFAADGSSQQTFDELERVISFFWSPDGSRLAIAALEEYVPPLPEASRPGRRARPAPQSDSTPDIILVWYIVDVESGELTRSAEFFPTTELFYILQFFDQYMQSHRLWSPDSRHLVYANQPFDQDTSLIQMIDTDFPEEPPVTLMEGNLAIFSFDE